MISLAVCFRAISPIRFIAKSLAFLKSFSNTSDNSSSEYSHDIIIDNLNNSLKKNILNINKKIADILTIIEHELDFTEEEIDVTRYEKIIGQLSQINKSILIVHHIVRLLYLMKQIVII